MKLNTKLISSIVMFALVACSLPLLATAEEQGQRLGRKVDQAVSATAEKAEGVKSTVKDWTSKAKDKADKLAHNAHKAKKQAEHKAHKAKKTAEHKARKAKDKLAHNAHKAKKQAEHKAHKAKQKLKHNAHKEKKHLKHKLQ